MFQRIRIKNRGMSGRLCLLSPQSSHCRAAMNVTKTRGRANWKPFQTG